MAEDEKKYFDQDQYDMLKRCSDAEDMTEWNDWHEQNPDVHIQLKGADLRSPHLGGANLSGAHLKGAVLTEAHLGGADLSSAYLKDANLDAAHLEGATLKSANLEGTRLNFAHLEDTIFVAAIVNGLTVINLCYINHKTDFTGVGLDSARVSPGLKQSLKNNIRRKHWQEWCKYNPWYLAWLTRFFFWLSDYGTSAVRILKSFFLFALAFAAIYYFSGPDTIANLFTVDGDPLPRWLVPFRAVYFSIVTMTTLGFGDMYAGSHSVLGHILLIFHVLAGYALLGALITRLAIVFTGEGPALSSEFDMDKGKLLSRLYNKSINFLKSVSIFKKLWA